MGRAEVTVAAIDIGSNSVRLLIVDADGSEVARETHVTALGMGLETTGSFDASAYDATVGVIAGFAATIARLGVREVRAVATSASRDAHNGAALMAEVGQVLGIVPSIIDGTREAGLAFAGATRGRPESGAKLVIDIGGGSTEFVYGVDTPSYAMSVDMGSVRLTDRCFDQRPATVSQLERARSEADTAFAPVVVCGDPEVAIGVAGTFTTLAAIALRLERYDADLVQDSTLDVDLVGSLIAWLSKLTVAETAQIPSLDPARARVILAGAIAVERALVHCEIESVTVSDRGLLDGLVSESATP